MTSRAAISNTLGPFKKNLRGLTCYANPFSHAKNIVVMTYCTVKVQIINNDG
jgi:hypothetical protein